MNIGDSPAQLGQIEAADAMMIDGKIVTRDDYRALAAQVEAWQHHFKNFPELGRTGDKALYVVCGYDGDYDNQWTRLIEAESYDAAETLLMDTHFPDVDKIHIHFSGRLTDMLNDILK